MIRKTKLLALIFILVSGSGFLAAQESDGAAGSAWSLGADLVSRYIWRGINVGGSSPSIQPGIEYAFGNSKHSFVIGAWGAYSLSGSTTGQEADLYLGYTLDNLWSMTVTDYFFPAEGTSRYDYFNYNMNWDKIDSGDRDQTGHVVEVSLSFNGTESFPVSLLFAMNVWGADARKYEEASGVMVPVDKICMTKYVELGYSGESKGTAFDLFAGAVLTNPDTEKGEPEGFYGQRSAGIINLGLTISKNIDLSDKFSLPVSGSLITNPEAGNIYMVLGISF